MMKKRYKIIIGIALLVALVAPNLEYSFNTSVEKLEEQDIVPLTIDQDGEHSESDHEYNKDGTYEIKVDATISLKDKKQNIEESI